MADQKISQLTAATTPLAGTEVFPIVQSGSTVKATIANVQAAPIAAQTASRMLYLDASKVPSTSANATFDGTNLGLGASPTFYGGRLAVGGHVAVSGGNSLKLWNTGGTGLATLTSTGTNGLTIAASGNTTLSDGNLVQGTAAKGINFTANTPAAGMTSQLLNWYEEGTWTPTVSKTVTDPQFTYTLQEGYYTRTGRMVFICGRIGVSTVVSNGSGYWILSGLPFTVGANSSGSVSLAGIVSGGADGLNFNSGATTALITLNGSLLTSNTVGSNYLYFAGCYHV